MSWTCPGHYKVHVYRRDSPGRPVHGYCPVPLSALAVWVRICICLILAKIFADVRLLMCLILVIFCDTKGFQLLNFATFFKLVLHGNKYIYQITNLLTVNK